MPANNEIVVSRPGESVDGRTRLYGDFVDPEPVERWLLTQYAEELDRPSPNLRKCRSARAAPAILTIDPRAPILVTVQWMPVIPTQRSHSSTLRLATEATAPATRRTS